MDKITFRILEDGTIVTQTPGISGENHLNADKFLRHVQELAGGSVERTKVQHGHHHDHAHDHAHDHDHEH